MHSCHALKRGMALAFHPPGGSAARRCTSPLTKRGDKAFQMANALTPQGTNCLRGPSRSGKFFVLSTSIPAAWSQLKRVTVSGHLAFLASADELTHNPRSNVRTRM